MEQKCILCGKKHAAGLQIMGCFLCFPCERALLKPGLSLSISQRRRLAQLADPIRRVRPVKAGPQGAPLAQSIKG